MIRFLLTVLTLLSLATAAAAEERILNFVSDVGINVDASITVTETITVVAEGDQIKRGIFRDFPTRYAGKGGRTVTVGFEVLSVKRDGFDETFAVESIGNGERVRIGNRNVLLPPGPHTYEIRYRSTRQLGFFDGFDELYWNVTGNSWTFAIDRAEAIIRLPPGASIVQHAAYTGYQGATGSDVRVLSGEGQTYRAETTRPLAMAEGFTVAVGFTKGIVPPPPDPTLLSYKVLGGSVLLMLLYYVASWLLVGRDPQSRPVVPLFHPPADLGPAGVRYVWRKSFDDKTFAAAMIGLAAKGRLAISGNDHYTVEKRKDEGPALTPSERELYRRLPAGSLAIKQSNALTINGLRTVLASDLEGNWGRQTYRRNRVWFWAGIGLSLLMTIALLAVVRPEEFTMALLLVYVCGAVWGLFLYMMFKGVQLFRKGGWLFKFGAVLLLLTGFPVVMLGVAMLMEFTRGAEALTLAIYFVGLLSFPLMHILFFRLLSAHTVLGARLMNEIEGLRLYMTTAEEQRLDMLNPPEKTPALFERLLPYALALDCENQWSEKFASVLAAASYVAPDWYQGRSWDSDSFGNFTRDLGRSRYQPPSPGSGSGSFHTSSSSWSPGSSSGSGGGGSSGGGGGGGGGGGW